MSWPFQGRKLTTSHSGVQGGALCLPCSSLPALPPFTCPCRGHLWASRTTPLYPNPATGIWSNIQYSCGVTLFSHLFKRDPCNLVISGKGFILEILETNIPLITDSYNFIPSSSLPLGLLFHLEIILPLTPPLPPIPHSVSVRSLQSLLSSLTLTWNLQKSLPIF